MNTQYCQVYGPDGLCGDDVVNGATYCQRHLTMKRAKGLVLVEADYLLNLLPLADEGLVEVEQTHPLLQSTLPQAASRPKGKKNSNRSIIFIALSIFLVFCILVCSIGWSVLGPDSAAPAATAVIIPSRTPRPTLLPSETPTTIPSPTLLPSETPTTIPSPTLTETATATNVAACDGQINRDPAAIDAKISQYGQAHGINVSNRQELADWLQLHSDLTSMTDPEIMYLDVDCETIRIEFILGGQNEWFFSTNVLEAVTLNGDRALDQNGFVLKDGNGVPPGTWRTIRILLGPKDDYFVAPPATPASTPETTPAP